MTRVSIEQAEEQLAKLIQDAGRGEEIVITADDLPVARLVPVRPALVPRRAGSARGLILAISDDSDAPLSQVPA